MPEVKSQKVETYSSSDIVSYFKLPLSGFIYKEFKLWSGDFWQQNKGSINYRWNSPSGEGFNLTSPNREALPTMTLEELKALSPAEKYDLLMGHYEYPLRDEVAAKSFPTAEESDNLVNGWATASLNHDEPFSKLLPNPDGVLIPFGSSDIKALLSYYYATVHKQENVRKLGNICEANTDCKDGVDAGVFHVMLANRVGKQQKSFFVDVERYGTAWNHPVQGYSTLNLGDEKKIGKDAAEGTARIIKLKTTLTYVDRAEANTWDVILTKPEQNLNTIDYRYNVYLNAKEEVIGGKWLSTEKPEMVWTQKGTKDFEGYFAGLKSLIND